jgi:hypothetical protein
MKVIRFITGKVRFCIAAVRRCSQPVQTTSNIIEVYQPKEIKVKEVEKIHIEIFFYDGTSLAYNRKRDSANETYVHAYFQFYKWYFMREKSDIFTFRYNGGAEIFYRKDIKRVSFYTTKEAENGN